MERPELAVHLDGMQGRRLGRVIKTAAAAFAGLPAHAEVRNEARVHLWYEKKFGVACTPHASNGAGVCFEQFGNGRTADLDMDAGVDGHGEFGVIGHQRPPHQLDLR